MWFDSHCHLDFPAYAGDRDAVLARAMAAEVCEFFVPGVSRKQWGRLRQLKLAYPRWRVGVGLHPEFLGDEERTGARAETGASPEVELGDGSRQVFAAPKGTVSREPVGGSAANGGQVWQEDLEKLELWLYRLEACAIGEFGLDSRVGPRGDPVQTEVARAHLQLAHRLRLPVVLHVVGRHGLMLELLQESPPPVGGVLHAFSGSPELVSRYASFGLSFGYGPLLLQPNARRVVESLKVTPAERLLLETDGPGGGPRVEPGRLIDVAQRVAQWTGLALPALARQTTENAVRLFDHRTPEAG